MRERFYFLAVALCCMLPFMAQGADLDPDEPTPGPRSMLISPVTVNAEPGMLTLYFTSDFGEVYILLQPVAKKINYFQSVDTSIQNQAVFTAPAGTYILTVTDTAGNIIKQEYVAIP
ncbi:MAG: hypothetical protein LBV72_19860 [Tannerella sp.]|jgi:hypothetical protein|nr:hypothetical protein [Tannerella sp.]